MFSNISLSTLTAPAMMVPFRLLTIRPLSPPPGPASRPPTHRCPNNGVSLPDRTHVANSDHSHLPARALSARPAAWLREQALPANGRGTQ